MVVEVAGGLIVQQVIELLLLFKACWAEFVLDVLLLVLKKLDLVLYSFTLAILLWVVQAVWSSSAVLSTNLVLSFIVNNEIQSDYQLYKAKKFNMNELAIAKHSFLDMPFNLPGDQRKIIIQEKHK